MSAEGQPAERIKAHAFLTRDTARVLDQMGFANIAASLREAADALEAEQAKVERLSQQLAEAQRELADDLADPAEQRAERYALEAADLSRRLIEAEAHHARSQQGLRELARYSIVGRYGGNYEWRQSPSGEWIRADELEAALSSGVEAPSQEGTTPSREKD